MKRRDFLIGTGALAVSAAAGPLLFRRGRAFAGDSVTGGLIPFNDNDTLENIRAIIRHNDFRFEVDHNWPYDHYGYAATQADVKPLNIPQIIIPPDPVQTDPDLPMKFDLRNINGRCYIGPIRDQGETQSCQFFGATSLADAAYNLHNKLYDDNCITFSPMYQRCVYNGGSDANLGLFYGMTRTGTPWEEPAKLAGVCQEEDFPFISFPEYGGDAPPAIQVAEAGKASRITFRRCCMVYPYNYWDTVNKIKRAIYKYGAVASGFLLSSALRAYKSGVYEDAWIYPMSQPYTTGQSNHAIALVGWDDNPPEGGNGGCWILRNSWGKSWGEGGYMRIRYFSAGVNWRNAYLEAESPDNGNLKICGKIMVNKVAAAWTNVTLSGDDSFEAVAIDENYGFATLKPGRYRVTPYKPGVGFTPLYQDLELTADNLVVNFSGVTPDA